MKRAIVIVAILGGCRADGEPRADVGTGDAGPDLRPPTMLADCVLLLDEESCWGNGCVWFEQSAYAIEVKDGMCVVDATPTPICLAINPPEGLSVTLTTYYRDDGSDTGLLLPDFFGDRVDGYVLCDQASTTEICDCTSPPAG